MNPFKEICQGACSLFVVGLCHFIDQIYPMISLIAMASGAILGIHGVYRLIRPKKGTK